MPYGRHDTASLLRTRNTACDIDGSVARHAYINVAQGSHPRSYLQVSGRDESIKPLGEHDRVALLRTRNAARYINVRSIRHAQLSETPCLRVSRITHAVTSTRTEGVPAVNAIIGPPWVTGSRNTARVAPPAQHSVDARAAA